MHKSIEVRPEIKTQNSFISVFYFQSIGVKDIYFDQVFRIHRRIAHENLIHTAQNQVYAPSSSNPENKLEFS
jgi:hypothetical protein